MAANLDRSLDEILSDRKSSQPRQRRRGDGSSGGPSNSSRRDERREYPRDGIRKPYREEPRYLDTEWVHDRYEDDLHPRRSGPRQRRGSTDNGRDEPASSKLKVENIHYDLSKSELEGLFERIGPVSKLVLVYDRAGRSEGLAYVTYEHPEDAREAIREFDGANANGQPIRLTLLPAGPARGRARNPFDTAVMPGRPLSERITMPSNRSQSHSPSRNQDVDDAASKGIDRYVPDARSRSPAPRRRGIGAGGGRRPGARREALRDQQGRDGGRGDRGAGTRPRPRKTPAELDEEMADYFGSNDAGGLNYDDEPSTSIAPRDTRVEGDDVDMIE